MSRPLDSLPIPEESDSDTRAPSNSVPLLCPALGSHPHPHIQLPCSSTFTDAGPGTSTLTESPSPAPIFIALVGNGGSHKEYVCLRVTR